VCQPKAYPVYDQSYREHVRAVRTDLEVDFPSFHLVGRNGMHKIQQSDHAMMTAMLTVKTSLPDDASMMSGALTRMPNIRIRPLRRMRSLRARGLFPAGA
jgi:protoporphyrinogen oxidase